MSADASPRDLVGYGSRPPDPHWPDEAVIAVSIVLNYEEGGEYSLLHGDDHAEFNLTDVGVHEPLLGARHLNVESAFEYGSRVGFWEIMRLLQTHEVDATVYAVGLALERHPEAAAAIAKVALKSPATVSAGSTTTGYRKRLSEPICCAILTSSRG